MMINGRMSKGVELDFEKNFRVFSWKRDLLKFLDKNLDNGSKFAVIFNVVQKGFTHAMLISNQPLVFGQDYRISTLAKKKKGKDPRQAAVRFQNKDVVGLIKKCIQFDFYPPPWHNHRTEQEFKFVQKIEYAIMFGHPLPGPMPITTAKVAEFATKNYKCKFPLIWKGTGEEKTIEPKVSIIGPTVVSHGGMVGATT